MLSLRESVSDPVQRAITRSALWRGVIAAVLVPITLVILLVALDVWRASVGAAFLALPGNLLLAVVAIRAFLLARRGAQTERGASTDRALVLVCLVVGGFMLVLPALTALGAPGGIAVAIYAVAITAVLVVLCRSNWRTPSFRGSARRPRPRDLNPPGDWGDLSVAPKRTQRRERIASATAFTSRMRRSYVAATTMSRTPAMPSHSHQRPVALS